MTPNLYEANIEKAMWCEHINQPNQAIIWYKRALKYHQSGPVKKVEVQAKIDNLIKLLNQNCEKWHENQTK